LEDRAEDGKGQKLDHLVAHAGAATASEGQEVLRFDETTGGEESLRLEFFRLVPQLGAGVQLVVVEEYQCVFLHFVS